MEELKLNPATIARVFAPRERECHKGNFGYVTLIGGSAAYLGAAKLANLSAASLRAGCGVVRLAVPQSLADAVRPFLLESTLCALPDKVGSIICDEAALHGALSGVRAYGIGMGWEENAEYLEVLKHLLLTYEIPTVVDAGALNVLAGDLSILDRAVGQIILTPHPKEFSRLSGMSVAQIGADPVTVAGDFAKRHHCIVLLKGAHTCVTDGTRYCVVDRGCAGMATAGSGDVLTGILTGMLGYLPPTVETIGSGAYLAGVAGELAEQVVTDIAMVASDTIAQIPAAIHAIRAAL